MPLTLTVDAAAWREHLGETLSAYPGLVPVIKGNGYGFGKTLLAQESSRLGVDMVAVGQYDEVGSVTTVFPGSVLVLTPWRPFASADLDDRRLIHTVSRPEDLDALIAAERPIRVVLERATSMLRHGMSAQELERAGALAARSDAVTVEGLTLHLPLDEARRLDREVRGILEETDLTHVANTVFVSHLSAGEVLEIERNQPGLSVRPRIGTELWLGASASRLVSATVLDVHQIERHQHFGYRRRRATRPGTLLVVSGGTAHGIGEELPVAATDLRSRGRAAARGMLESLGYLRSPYFIDGRQCRFAEPPHMQVSMLWLPGEAAEPSVGDTLKVRVRETTTDFDEIVLT